MVNCSLHLDIVHNPSRGLVPFFLLPFCLLKIKICHFAYSTKNSKAKSLFLITTTFHGGWEPVTSWAIKTCVCACSCLNISISSYTCTLGWAFLTTHIAHQPCSFKVCYKNSSTLGRLGAVTLAASMLVVQIEEAQKLVQLSGVWNE